MVQERLYITLKSNITQSLIFHLFLMHNILMSVDLLWHSQLSVLCRTCLLQQLRKYLLLPCSLEQSGCILFGMLECFLSPLGEGELHWMSAELENCPASSSLAVKWTVCMC